MNNRNTLCYGEMCYGDFYNEVCSVASRSDKWNEDNYKTSDVNNSSTSEKNRHNNNNDQNNNKK